LGAFHILATSVVILKGINHISIPYIETVDLQPTKIPCYSLLPAKPPDITEKCDLLFWKKQAATIQSYSNLVDKFKQPFQMLNSLNFELLHWKNIRLLDLECSACCKRSSQQLFGWHIQWDSCSASGHWKIKSWDVDNTIDSMPTIKQIVSMFSLTLQTSEFGNPVSVAVLLCSQLSHVWVLYLPHCSITHCGTKMMPWETASTDGLLTCAKRVLIPWDPGGLVHDLTATWNITQLQLSHLTWDPGGVKLQFCAMAFLVWLVMPWDPGGSVWCRLEVKPTFKEEGLSATSLLGRHSWAWPALKTPGTTTNTMERPYEWIGLDQNGKAASAEAPG
jgi:hypothetical protein